MKEEKVRKVILFSHEKKMIGERIAQICDDKGITQLELCCKAFVSEGGLSRIVNGKQNFEIDTLLCILAELKMSLYEFFNCDSLQHVVIRVKSEWAPEKGIRE